MREANGTTRPLARLAAGGSAELYALPDGRAVKLFKAQVPRETIELELHHARLAHGLGVPTPRADGLLSLEGRTGIVFERCDGPTLYELIVARAQPAETLAELFFELQSRIHACECPSLAPLNARLARRVARVSGVSEDAKRAALALLEAPSTEARLCHGDFHPMNVIVADGRGVVIDWLDAGRGDPAIDVVRTLLHLQHSRRGAVEASYRAAFLRSYMRHCRAAWAGALERVERWGLPVAIARLAERIDDAERAALQRFVAGFDAARPVAAA